MLSEMQIRLREEYDRTNEVVGFFETTKNNVLSYGLLEKLSMIEMEIWG